MISLIARAIAIGIGATLTIDLWAFVLRTAFGVKSLDYCLLGRWVLHMRRGTFVHANIRAAAPKAHECGAGWTAHYSIGVAFAALFTVVLARGWIEHPSVAPALAFGAVTVVVPFFTMQPAFGLGIAARHTAHPNAARLKSLMTHTIFGLGLYVSAHLLQFV